MDQQKSRRYHIWLDQAKFDLDAAQVSLDAGFFEWACYQSVQSVEKCLKAVLVHAGWRPPKTHKLGALLSMCNYANEFFVEVRLNYRKVEAYTFISRYPFVYPNQDIAPHDLITKDDALTCITLAQDLHIEVHSFLDKNIIKARKPVALKDYYFTAEDIQKRITEVVDVLQTDAQLRVEKIILFGSFARESTRPKTSTMDLIIIARTALSFIERIKYVREITRGGEPIIEPLIYTPHEFDVLLNEEGEGFIESAIDEGKVIFEKR